MEWRKRLSVLLSSLRLKRQEEKEDFLKIPVLSVKDTVVLSLRSWLKLWRERNSSFSGNGLRAGRSKAFSPVCPSRFSEFRPLALLRHSLPGERVRTEVIF